MQGLLNEIISELEESFTVLNREREEDGLVPLKKAVITLLGQFGLIVHPVAGQRLKLAATNDVDALIEADWSIRAVFVAALKRQQLIYDELSSEAWIPPGSAFEVLYDSPVLTMRCLAPLAILTSKAVKAKER